ncbi:uracil-DNA glycosylase family protein [Rhodovibrionaceae bacterium A322]
MSAPSLAHVFARVRACHLCEEELPFGPRPVVRGSAEARVLIIGQAPGSKVHASGIPFDDRSGDRLRDWLGIGKDLFYDESKLAIMPMGFCYPGRNPKGGDLPPLPRCAPTWHPLLRPAFTGVELTLLVGSYAQNHYLAKTKQKTMTETVAHWRDYQDKGLLPLPHPSWRNTAWLKKNPWFESDVLPHLRQQIRDLF